MACQKFKWDGEKWPVGKEIFTRIENLGENGEFGKNTWKVWTKFKWEDNKSFLDNNWFSEKGKFLPKMVNLTKV